MKEKTKKTTVDLYESQFKWMRKNHFKLSSFVREQLNKEIQKRSD